MGNPQLLRPTTLLLRLRMENRLLENKIQTRAGQERSHSPLTQSDQVNQAAANSFGNTGKQSGMGRMGTQTDNLESKQERTKRKVHAAFGCVATTIVCLGAVHIDGKAPPKYRCQPPKNNLNNRTGHESAMSATDIASNDSFTFHNSKCYETRLLKMSFVGAMEMKSPTTRLETTGRLPTAKLSLTRRNLSKQSGRLK